MNIINRERKLKHKNQTPLHYAADWNFKEIAELLLSKGANINTKTIICHISAK